MTATAEQADLAQRIILECLDKHDQHREPFQQVWTEPAHDFDDVPVLDVWVIYDGEPRSLDTALHNTFHTYLMEELRNAGVYAIPSISYIITRTALNNRAYIPHCVDRLKYPRPATVAALHKTPELRVQAPPAPRRCLTLLPWSAPSIILGPCSAGIAPSTNPQPHTPVRRATQ